MSNLWTPRAGNVLTYGQATFEDGSTGNSVPRQDGHPD